MRDCVTSSHGACDTIGCESHAVPVSHAIPRRLRRNTRDFDADGRVLRLKRFVPADCRPPVIDAVLDALAANTRVEVLYMQNFERGFGDEQLMHLLQVCAQRACRPGAVRCMDAQSPLTESCNCAVAGAETRTHLGRQCGRELQDDGAGMARIRGRVEAHKCAVHVRVGAPLHAHRPQDAHA